MPTDVWIAVAVAVGALIALAVAARADMRKAAQATDEQRETALLAPHAKWLHQHDVDRQFNAIVAELKAGAE